MVYSKHCNVDGESGGSGAAPDPPSATQPQTRLALWGGEALGGPLGATLRGH